tara:strand:+ start:2304 stop:3461 length:1158 start_codon:yes stop_codon:yes gene_type:complete
VSVEIEGLVKVKNSKLVVVLGMHRSGTSAITRGLEVLGVNLGDNLYPAAIDNPKGFWEDNDFLGINEELLAHLDYSVDRLGLIDWQMPSTAIVESLELKAEKLVSERCKKNALWGFKDPRTARLLPFWQAVFERVGCDVRYVIATRNPISIVESLYKRSGFEGGTTFYLWLEHLIPAISGTMNAKRVVVDYDQLLENPKLQLLRVAKALGVTAPEPLALFAFESEFLDVGLRHTYFTMQDLERYPSVPLQVVTAYDWLVKLANDSVLLDSAETKSVFEALSQELIFLSPTLNFIGYQEQKIVTFTQTIAEREQLIAALQAQTQDLQAQAQDQLKGAAWMTSQRDAWEQSAVQSHQAIAALDAKLYKIRSHWGMRLINLLCKNKIL